MPLVELEPGVFVLELFHGPTRAFKDVGARVQAHLSASLADGGGPRTIVVATSGDTGGAVADAFHDLEGFRVVVLFPRDGISPGQRRQMTTLGGNVTAVAVEGTFDDCQRLAKELLRDVDVVESRRLTSANSINVGRLLPQALYYVYAAIMLRWNHAPALFFVPSGNLGNLSAGLIAQRMGMPAEGFVAACNANSGFADFLGGAPFEPRPTIRTESNAMDVGDPSNLERVLWLFGGDADQVRANVTGASVSDEAGRACAADVFARTGYVLDPHTAVAFEALRRHHTRAGPSVVLATADPAKFPDVVESAIGRRVPMPADLATMADTEEHMREVPATVGAIRDVLDDIAG